MLCNKEGFQIELSCMIVLLQIFISHRSAWFPLLSACRRVEFDTSVCNLPCVLCIVKAHFYRQYILSNLHKFAFEGQNMKFTVNVLLTCILYCAPGPSAIRLFASTVGRFLSRMSYFVLV